MWVVEITYGLGLLYLFRSQEAFNVGCAYVSDQADTQ